MPSRREGDIYTHHRPRSGDSQAPQQFTWREMSHLAFMGFSYLMGLCVHISIVVDKYSLEEPPKNRGLYLAFLLLPHIVGGLKNLQYHYREAHEEEGEDSSMGWAIHLLLFPFSPLIRIFRAWRFGMAEKDDWENGIRLVDEMVTVGVLKLLEVLLGDAPTLCLLVRDDVWGRSADWSDHVIGSSDLIRCGPQCVLEPDNPLGSWNVSRMFFLLAKIAQSVVFYLTAVKRLQRLQNPEHYTHLRGNNALQGRLNIFAVFILYIAHFFFIGSRIMGYSMVSAAWGSWVYLIIGGHWLLNIGWHLITILNSGGTAGARSVSSMIMGGVWLITLTNEQGGRQLGRFIMYYLLAFAESAVCGYLWNSAMKGSGDFFAHKSRQRTSHFKGVYISLMLEVVKPWAAKAFRKVLGNTRTLIGPEAPWSLLIVFMFGLIAHITYYSLCHPGTPAITKQGLLCCSGNRRDPLNSEEDKA